MNVPYAVCPTCGDRRLAAHRIEFGPYHGTGFSRYLNAIGAHVRLTFDEGPSLSGWVADDYHERVVNFRDLEEIPNDLARAVWAAFRTASEAEWRRAREAKWHGHHPLPSFLWGKEDLVTPEALGPSDTTGSGDALRYLSPYDGGRPYNTCYPDCPVCTAMWAAVRDDAPV